MFKWFKLWRVRRAIKNDKDRIILVLLAGVDNEMYTPATSDRDVYTLQLGKDPHCVHRFTTSRTETQALLGEINNLPLGQTLKLEFDHNVMHIPWHIAQRMQVQIGNSLKTIHSKRLCKDIKAVDP
jgi:hypothetical protein